MPALSPSPRSLALLTPLLLVVGCFETRGSAWVTQPLGGDELPSRGEPRQGARRTTTRTIAERHPSDEQSEPSAEQSGGGYVSGRPAASVTDGRSLGVFRNTYYNFPDERDYQGGDDAQVMSGACSTIATVPRGFFEAVCVQGSGRLRSGQTISFARRDCECADLCPRSGQKICFEPLDRASFPWGRGAMGTAITPLRTVAVDSAVIPLGTPIYIPEFDGLPLDEEQSGVHDGCFIAQDRGTRVVGEHVDVFTGRERTTAFWNRLVPSNKGVNVVLDHPRCKR